MPGGRQPLLFYDVEHDTVNRYGGWPYGEIAEYPSTVWSFAAGSAEMDWQQGPNASSKGLSADSIGPFAAAHAYSDKAFFSFGGSYYPDNSMGPSTVLSGLVVYDFSSGLWNNYSTAFAGQTTHHTQARAISSPDFGTNGYLFIVGGEAPPTVNSQYNEGFAMVDLSAITLYDIANQAWFVQTATGDIPPVRTEFCAVGSPSRDGETFEMYVSPDLCGLSALHVLIMPPDSFSVVLSTTPSIWQMPTMKATRTCSCFPCQHFAGSRPMQQPK